MRKALAGLLVCGACSSSAEPVAPKTREDAARRFDEAIVALGWAQQDLWKLGGRDIVVSVQIDSTLPPQYFRLPRR